MAAVSTIEVQAIQIAVLMDYPAILNSEIPFMAVLPMVLRPIMAACEVIPVSEGITEATGATGAMGATAGIAEGPADMAVVTVATDAIDILLFPRFIIEP